MEKNRYDQLKSVTIEKSGIVKNNISDPIFKFCVLNKINNLGDFIVFYNANKQKMDGRHNFYYFDGVIDLISLVFFSDKLSEEKLLMKRIKIFNNKNAIMRYAYTESNGLNGRSENATLRRLGFNNEETKAILNHVLYLNKEMSVISAIKSCIDNFNFKKMDKEDEMFITKLYILWDYYNKNKIKIETIDSFEYSKVKEDIKELKKLYRKMFKLQQKILDLSCDFENKIDKLPADDESVKKLIREYQSFNCK